MTTELKLGFLASGGGSNVQAIIDNIKSGKLNAEACAVISNNSSAGVLERAAKEGIPYYHISSKTNPDDTSEAIINAFKSHGVNTIILAGYMKKLDPAIIEAFNGRVLNIHPALLPKYGGKGMFGLNVHKAVLEAGEEHSGATIHRVTHEYDDGDILGQKFVPVLPDDIAETLAARVLEVEHQVYTETLQKIADGEIEL